MLLMHGSPLLMWPLFFVGATPTYGVSYAMTVSLSKMFSGYYSCKIKVVWLLLSCLMQLAKYTIHNHRLLSLSATRATTQWLKQCSDTGVGHRLY